MLLDVTSNLKRQYRRYMVQIPVNMADEIDNLVESETSIQRSASHVIVENLQKGMFGSGVWSPEQVRQWQRDELAMLKACRMAIDALHGPEADRVKRLQEMARFVIDASMRKPAERYEQADRENLLAAESPHKDSIGPPTEADRSPGAGPRHRVSA